MPGLLAAVAGLAAAVAPLLHWFEIDIDIGQPGLEATVSTTGWGSTDMDLPVGAPSAGGQPWDGWAFAGIPDGVIATLLGVAVLVVGLRVALGAGRAGGSRRPAVITGLGLVGLLWMGGSWLSAQRKLSDSEEMFAAFSGLDEQQLEELFTLDAGSGFFLCAVAFAIVTLAGFASLWSSIGRNPAPLVGAAAEPGRADTWPPTAPTDTWAPTAPAGPAGPTAPSGPTTTGPSWATTPLPGRPAPVPAGVPRAVPPAVADALAEARRDGPPPPAPPGRS